MKKSFNFQAWVVVITAALFFFYEFIQMNMFNSLSFVLLQTFSIDNEKLGLLSSFYFIANVIFLFPAGIILDRFSTRKVILTTLAICISGIIFFSMTNTYAFAAFGRFLMGVGSAFCFLSVIRLSSRWFPPHHMAFVTGVVVTMAMLGGFVSQAPITTLIQNMSWRHVLWLDAALGGVVFVAIALIVRDFPEDHHIVHRHEQEQIRAIGYFKSLKMAFAQTQNWLCGIYAAFMNLPIGLLGGLWGGLYLVATHHLTKIDASHVSSMLFLGCVFGSPLMGWISDKVGVRRPPMYFGAILSLLLFCVILFSQHLGFGELLVLFLLIGISTSSQIISYPFVAERSKRMITAMSVSAVNITALSSYAIFQPFFGFLIDFQTRARGVASNATLIPSDFHWAIILFPIGFVISILAVIATKETFCRFSETENHHSNTVAPSKIAAH